MGSLTSRPKLPNVQQQPQIIYMPTPVTQPVITPTVPTTPSGEGNTKPNTTEQIATREKNLLTASRGRLGTVTTSFRGLLGLASGSGTRKTLLGE